MNNMNDSRTKSFPDSKRNEHEKIQILKNKMTKVSMGRIALILFLSFFIFYFLHLHRQFLKYIKSLKLQI